MPPVLHFSEHQPGICLVGILAQVWPYGTGVVLDGNSLWCQTSVQVLRMNEILYTQVHLAEDAYTRGLYVQMSRMCIHARLCTEKHVHGGKLIFGPWLLVLGI